MGKGHSRGGHQGSVKLRFCRASQRARLVALSAQHAVLRATVFVSTSWLAD